MTTESLLVPPTLFVSRDRPLLETRLQLLQEAGLFVMPSDPTQFPVLLNEYRFEALILCNTLSDDEKGKLIEQFKQRYQTGRVVSIDPTPGPHSIRADIQMEAPVMPQEWQRLCQALKSGSPMDA